MTDRDRYEASPDETYLRDAMGRGVASIRDVPMKALGRPDTKYQARVRHLDMEHVERLTFILDEQGSISPIVVFAAGDRHILADGFHRHEVYRRRQLPMIPAYVIEVEPDRVEREAMLFASMCNRNMSLGRTSQDIRKAVEMLFAVPECWNWTDRRIGDHCGVSGHTVKLYRTKYALDRNLTLPDVVNRADGKPRKYNREDKEAPTLRERKRNGRKSGYLCSTKGKRIYLGASEEKAKAAVEGIASGEASRRRNLGIESLRYFLSARGYAVDRCGCTFTSHPGMSGLHGYGCVLTSTDFRSTESIVSSVGRLRMLRILVDMPEARMVVVCYREDGPKALIELAERDGIEFLTPEGLAGSISPPRSDTRIVES